MTDTSVPIIDIAPLRNGSAADKKVVAAEIDRACREIGFIVIAGHGVPDDLVDNVFAASARFFALPLADKLRCLPPDPALQRGYVAFSSHALAYTLGDTTPPDLSERFRFGRVDVPDDDYHRARKARFFHPNIWPDSVPGFEAALSDYYRAMETLAATLMRGFALALDLPETFFDTAIDRHVTACAINHYPPQKVPAQAGQLRAGAHSDYGSLTVLKAEDAPGGLQVRDRAGNWRDVAPVPGTFIVNIGDLMAQWTNDRWVSTVHRVVNPPADIAASSARTSLVFFHQPNEDARVECLPSCQSAANPPKYPPTTSGAHLMSKVMRQRPPAAAE